MSDDKTIEVYANLVSKTPEEARALQVVLQEKANEIRRDALTAEIRTPEFQAKLREMVHQGFLDQYQAHLHDSISDELRSFTKSEKSKDNSPELKDGENVPAPPQSDLSAPEKTNSR